MRQFGFVLIGAAMMFSLSGHVAHGQTASPPPPPQDRASYFSATELDKIWKDLETRKVNTKRIIEGSGHHEGDGHQINVRIVTPDSPPLVHHKSGDIWIVQGGTAISVTGGTLKDAKLRGNSGDDYAGTAIEGGVEQLVKTGDVVYVPIGVPHGFKDMKGFRAFLIRWGT